tara:strand:+ start:5675 stop:6178 length:504 start_codon:yes stop_codon:yes gene_type:complete
MILTKNEIKGLFGRYRDAVRYIKGINEGHISNQRIKQVQFPSNLTESYIYHYLLQNPHLINQNKISPTQLSLGSFTTYDIICNVSPPINIEVKGTGTNGFQGFRVHSLTSNYVFWINLNSDLQFDLAVFNPKILLPVRNKNGEVLISWKKLLGGYINNITLIKNISV